MIRKATIRALHGNTLSPKALDRAIDKFFNMHAKNVQIPLLSISDISKAGKAAYEKSHDLADVEEAVKTAIAAHRVN